MNKGAWTKVEIGTREGWGDEEESVHTPIAETNEEKDDKRKEKERALNVQIIIDMARRRGVAVTFAKKCALTAPMFFVFSIMQVHLINTFQVTPEMNSFIQMFVGMLIMLNNGFAIVWLRKRFNEDYLLTSGAAALLLANVLLTQWYTLWLVFCTLPFICLGLGLVSTVADSLLTSQVQLDEQALILGASQATNSLIRTFGPAAAGYMLEHYGFAIFGLIGAAISTIVLLHDLSPIPTLVKSTTSNHSSTSNDREAKRHQ
ncbi:Solute carrier family 22 member 18 [Toxocara canis]|uniref:Solute carrier family 22 member 18 n=1 Tax=Toxocara canis TaxID=6265 RepID=A0A0B2V6G2_TOXCA|nr:Solute carrier family 22 member 18 [Toxocara canis]